MVKNTVGGKKGKMMANKNGNGIGGGSGQLRLVDGPGIEIIVCVTKVFGGGLFEVIDNENTKYKAFLRGKMKGHNKRHNLVSLFSILLVAKRVDTDPEKCDILFVYDSHDIQFLALNPTLNIHNLLSFHNNHCTTSSDNNNDTDGIIFNNLEDNNKNIIKTTTTINMDVHNSDDDNTDINFDLI